MKSFKQHLRTMREEKYVKESDQLDELSDNLLFSARYKAHTKGRTRLTGKIDNELIKRKLLHPPTTSMRERENQYMAHRDANRARLKAQGMQGENPISEADVRGQTKFDFDGAKKEREDREDREAAREAAEDREFNRTDPYRRARPVARIVAPIKKPKKR